jgi:hypothetical protein
MIPRWQMAGMFLLLLIVVGLAIHNAPHSYAYAFLTGLCWHQSAPPECHLRGFRSAGWRSY